MANSQRRVLATGKVTFNDDYTEVKDIQMTQRDDAPLDKIIADLLWMREQESKGVMAFANSDDTMFEDCIRRLKELAARPSETAAFHVPQGMKCVPTKPTPRMLETVGPITGYEGEHPDKDHSDWYAAMIEAAPTLTYARSTTGQWSDEDRRLAEHTAAQLAVSWYERRHLTHHQGDLIVRALKAVSATGRSE